MYRKILIPADMIRNWRIKASHTGYLLRARWALRFLFLPLKRSTHMMRRIHASKRRGNTPLQF